jgi:hypothetical protein
VTRRVLSDDPILTSPQELRREDAPIETLPANATSGVADLTAERLSID